MGKKFFLPFMMLILISAACGLPSFGENSASDNAAADPASNDITPLTPVQPAELNAEDGPFKAQVLSPIQVALSWDGLTAEKFRLEISLSGSDFVLLGELPGDRTSFEHSPVLPDRIIQYRLTAVDGSGAEVTKTVAVQTPPQVPSPLTVTLINDMTLPDPASMDLTTIDPNNLDINALTSMFSPTLISSSAEIGPEGGELSVQSSTGVIYTYRIPAGALDEPITFTLKPYTGIEGAPLDGMLLGAVQIDPVGLELDEPAILTIEPATGSTAASDDMAASFGFMPDGSEFYFFAAVTASEVQASSDVGKVAAPALQKDEWVMRPWEIPQTRTGPAGIGVTRRSTLRKQAVDHPPSDQHSRTAQNNTSGEDELTPLVPLDYLDFSQRSLGLSGWEDTLSLMDEMETRYTNAKDKAASLAFLEKAISQVIDRLERNFQLNLNNCISKDDFNAYYAAKSLKNPRLAFMKLLSERYQKKYGTATLEDVLKKAERCNLRLTINSTATVKGPDLDLELEIESSVPLKIRFDINTGSVYYTGTGPIQYLSTGGKAGECQASYATQGKSAFVVNRLKPIFGASSAILEDFDLSRYTTTASSNQFKAKCPQISLMVPIPDGTSAWGGFYTVSKYEDLAIRDWQVSPAMTGSDLATKMTDTTRTLPEGSVSEKSTFSLKVNLP